MPPAARGATALEVWAERAMFMSLQGAVVAPDLGALFVADHANGFLRVNLTTRVGRRLESPPNLIPIAL